MSWREFLFAGYGYDKTGPYFLLDESGGQQREKMYFDSVAATVEKLERRFCVGTYDLDTFKTKPCRDRAALEPQAKDARCGRCLREIGFNPAFYNASAVSPKQERYNMTPHVVYMAYFSPKHVKIGIASEKRYSVRLLEQGARAAVVLAKFGDAYAARALEERLCAVQGFLERLTSDAKLGLLISGQYYYERAKSDLLKMIEQHYDYEPAGELMDLTPYYFYGKTPPVSSGVYRADGGGDMVSGRLIGMIGDTVIISQSEGDDGALFAVPVKKYVSHIVRIYYNEVKIKYSHEARQLTFGDL